MKEFLATAASKLTSVDAVKVVKAVCGTILGIVGIACLCDYDLEMGASGMSLKKHD